MVIQTNPVGDGLFSYVKSFKSAKSPLPVDVHGSKWSLLSSHLSTILVPKKWEILCNAPSTENPWKLLITTNTLELRYPLI